MKKYDLYGIGSALVDIEVLVSEESQQKSGYQKGHMSLTSSDEQQRLLAQFNPAPNEIKLACGGSAANTTISHSCFGGKVFFSCMVGDDENAKFYLDGLTRAGVDSNARTNRGTTGECLIAITPDGERTMYTHLGINEQLSEDVIDKTALSQSRYLYLESYLLGTEIGHHAILTASRLCCETDTKIALSLSDPSMVSNFLERMRSIVDIGVEIVFCNEEEALCYTQCKNIDDALASLGKQVPHVVITRGKHGAVIQVHGERVAVKARQTDVKDTNGAGDMYAGAYMYGLSCGFDNKSAGEFAALCAAKIVSHYGPRLEPEEYKQLLHSYQSEKVN